MAKKVWERECKICNKIIKGGRASLTSFEDMFKRHLRKHKLLTSNVKCKDCGSKNPLYHKEFCTMGATGWESSEKQSNMNKEVKK